MTRITLHLVHAHDGDIGLLTGLHGPARISGENFHAGIPERQAENRYHTIRDPKHLKQAISQIEHEPGPVISVLERGPLRSELENACGRLGLPVVNLLDPVIALFDQPMTSTDLSSTATLIRLAKRVDTVAEALEELRLNSDDANNSIARLREAARNIRAEATGANEPTAEVVRAEAKRLLPLLLAFYESGTARTATKMIISGAIAGFLATGWPAAAIFSVSMAAWEGSDTLRSAIDAFLIGGARKLKRQRPRRNQAKQKR